MATTISNNPKRPEPQALASAIEALAARFGNRLITSQAVREQHAHTTTWLPTQPPDAVVMAQETVRYPGRGADLRQTFRSRDRVRHRHLAGGPGQRAGRRRLHRSARHEPDSRRSCRGPRLRDPARRHPQGAQRTSARPGIVLPDRSRRRRLARRHGLDAGVRHQRGALRHHARQRAGAESGARRRRDHHDRHAREKILGRLRPDASVRRRRRHARHHLPNSP